MYIETSIERDEIGRELAPYYDTDILVYPSVADDPVFADLMYDALIMATVAVNHPESPKHVAVAYASQQRIQTGVAARYLSDIDRVVTELSAAFPDDPVIETLATSWITTEGQRRLSS